MKNRHLQVLLLGTLISLNSFGQEVSPKANDSHAPLHLLKPAYPIPYGELSVESVKQKIDLILGYLQKSTPTEIENSKTGEKITDFSKLDANSQIVRGNFRIASYEWGVTYAAVLRAAEITGDAAYLKYATDRMRFLAAIAPGFRKELQAGNTIDVQMKQVLTPHALDDAGAVCAAMIKTGMLTKNKEEFRPLVENYMNYILKKEMRLPDGTFARNRPFKNTVWLDDMYMSLPAIAQYGEFTGDTKYHQEAARIVLKFADRMFVPEKGLFRHGWVEGMQVHPAFFWGRANGWAILTMCDVMDVLPKNDPLYPQVLKLMRAHIEGLSKMQSGTGFWHQLLDRNDSYLETSATAIYTYCIAHAINKGWIDAMAYAPVAQLGWEAVSTKITNNGEVEGTCVGTGMGFDPAFYYHRPVSNAAAHGYGPALLAGAEMIQLLKTQHPKMNDSAIQYYPTEQKTTLPIFSVEK